MILSRKQLWRRVKSYPIKKNHIEGIIGIPKIIKRVKFNNVVYYRLIPTNNELKEIYNKIIQNVE